MYLVYLQLCDDSILDGDFNKIVKVEKLQSFDAQIIKSQKEAQDREWISAVTYVPEKGGSFELHYHYCKSAKDLQCDDVIASAIFSESEQALSMADRFESVRNMDAFLSINESHPFVLGYMQFIALHS